MFFFYKILRIPRFAPPPPGHYIFFKTQSLWLKKAFFFNFTSGFVSIAFNKLKNNFYKKKNLIKCTNQYNH